jgi:hypothetical protein
LLAAWLDWPWLLLLPPAAVLLLLPGVALLLAPV